MDMPRWPEFFLPLFSVVFSRGYYSISVTKPATRYVEGFFLDNRRADGTHAWHETYIPTTQVYTYRHIRSELEQYTI